MFGFYFEKNPQQINDWGFKKRDRVRVLRLGRYISFSVLDFFLCGLLYFS
jgi:hypothetical protein